MLVRVLLNGFPITPRLPHPLSSLLGVNRSIIKTFLLACMTELILGFPLSLLHIFLFLYPARKHRHCLDYLWPFSLFYPLHWGSHPLSWFKRNISIVTFNLWLEVRAHQNALSVLPIACWTSLPHCPMGPSNLIHLWFYLLQSAPPLSFLGPVVEWILMSFIKSETLKLTSGLLFSLCINSSHRLNTVDSADFFPFLIQPFSPNLLLLSWFGTWSFLPWTIGLHIK